MALRLYTTGMSNNAFRASMYLREKGIEAERVEIDLMQGAHKKPEFVAVNPRGQVPALQDGDFVVVESVAILQYLEHTRKEKPLYPSKPEDAALCFTRIAQFQQKLDGCNVAGSAIFAKKTKEELADRIEKLKAEVNIWDGYLDGKTFLANEFSVADICIFPLIAVWVVVLGLSLDPYPNMKRWYEAVEKRPSVQEDAFWPIVTKMGSEMTNKVLA